MEYIFKCQGNPNILATHPRTLEITTVKKIGLDATQIIGVDASFDFSRIKNFLSCNRIKIIFILKDMEEIFECKINPYFVSKESIVFRKSDYESDKTLGVDCEKSALDINRKIVNELKNESTKLHIIIRKVD